MSAITGDRIAFVGSVRNGAIAEIDADGHVVTPGFIDGHTHMDAQVFWDATGSSSCWHGVTSAVMGNCGFTLAPVRSEQRALVVRNLERAEDIDPAALAAGIDWSFETFPRVPRCRRTASQRHQFRRQYRAFGPADLGHGRAGIRTGSDRRRSDPHE